MASARTPRGARREAIAARGGPEGQGAGPEPTPSRGGAGAGGGARRAQARGAAASQRDGRVGAGQQAAARAQSGPSAAEQSRGASRSGRYAASGGAFSSFPGSSRKHSPETLAHPTIRNTKENGDS